MILKDIYHFVQCKEKFFKIDGLFIYYFIMSFNFLFIRVCYIIVNKLKRSILNLLCCSYYFFLSKTNQGYQTNNSLNMFKTQ